jgi:membrane protein DedA with SNARE-associated domain
MFMLHHHYEIFTQWLHLHPQWSSAIAFIIAFSECIIVLGSIVPGSITMIAIGILVGSKIIPLWATLFSAILGAILGDSISYGLGYHFKDKIRRIWPFSHYPGLFISGQSFMLRHCGKSVFIGRFVGPIRAIIPVIAGMFDMKPSNYFSVSIPAACLWAPAYMLPGILIGAAAIEMPANIAKNIILLFLSGLIILWLLYESFRWIYDKTHIFLSIRLDALWKRWQLQPSKARWLHLLRNADPIKAHGQIIQSLLLIMLVIAYFGLALSVIYAHHQWFSPFNQMSYHFLSALRTQTLDKLMVTISSLGYSKAIIQFTVITALFFLLYRRFSIAIHLLVAIGLASITLFLFKHGFFIARPAGIVLQSSTSSFPSGHTTLAIVYYGIITFFLGRSLSKNFRSHLYLVTTLLCFLIAFSRLYLGAHWLTDVIGGSLLGTSILMFIIISAQRFSIPKFGIKRFAALIIILLLTHFSGYLHTYYQKDLSNHQKLSHYWNERDI